MNPENPVGARRRFPLHIHLSALFSALVLATGVAIAWLGYGEARELTLKATDEVFRHVGSETRAALAGALQPVGSFADLLALQPLARARTLERRLEALPFMRQGFAGHAPIAAAYAGYDDGSFFLVRPLRSDAERAFFEAPAGTALYAQNIDVGPGGARTVTNLYFDAALRELARRAPPAADFDPRTRPWYRLAERPGERVLTEPYVFFSTQAPGMTVAVRAGAESVVGVDVTLLQVSELLATLRTLPDMKIVLFGADRRVIARADLARTMLRREGDRVALATLDDFGEPVLAQMQPVRADGGDDAGRTLEAAGALWKTVVLPVPTARGMLSLGIAAPFDALLADARAARTRGLLAALAILLVALPLTRWVAHRVGGALRALTREAQDIRAFRFDGAAVPPSIVLEIDQLAGAMSMMRGTIRHFLDIATSLAAETNFRRLLDRVVAETSATMHAAGGLVYLFESSAASSRRRRSSTPTAPRPRCVRPSSRWTRSRRWRRPSARGRRLSPPPRASTSSPRSGRTRRSPWSRSRCAIAIATPSARSRCSSPGSSARATRASRSPRRSRAPQRSRSRPSACSRRARRCSIPSSGSWPARSTRSRRTPAATASACRS